MKVLGRTARVTLTGLAALSLLLVIGLAVTSRLLENYLASPRTLQGARFSFHNPSVSMLFVVRADSAVVESPDARLMLTKPKVHFKEWKGWSSSGVAVRVQADSAVLSVHAGDTTATDRPVRFPDDLRFSVGWEAQWRVLSVRLPGDGGFAIGPARFESRGAQAIHGTFAAVAGAASLPVNRVKSPPETWPALAVTVDARWRGAALRYRVLALRPGRDTLLVSGIRDKHDLRDGFDSLHLRTARPDAWWNTVRSMAGLADSASPPPAALSWISEVAVNAKADWRRDSLKVSGRFRSDSAEPFDPAVWRFGARLGPGGGRFTVSAAGARQSLDFAGRWTQPHAWFEEPQWDLWRAELAGSVRAGTWKIAAFELPLDFDLPQARLETGRRVTARVLTPDATRIDLRWNGHAPRRLEIAGDLGLQEPWAVAWTRGHIDYAAAKVAGVWERSRLDITARVRAPKAYGAVADSLVAENRVTSSGYFLKEGRIYRGGEVFTGSGEVLWRNPQGERAVTLGFEARHAEDGRAAVVMSVPGPLTLSADSLRPARFPYEPLRRLAGLNPWIDGRFTWDPERGTGAVAARGRFGGEGVRFEAGLDARWTAESLRVNRAELASGVSRLSGEAHLPFDGRALRGLVHVEDIMGGWWNVRAEHLNVGDVFSLLPPAPQSQDAARSFRPDRGQLNGALGFSPGTGMTGVLRLDSLKLSARSGLPDVAGLVLRGMGDSLHAEALVPHRAAARWYDTLTAVFTRLNADTPGVYVDARSAAGFNARFTGTLPGWSAVQGQVTVAGRIPLTEGWGSLEEIRASGRVRGPLARDFVERLALTEGILSFRHASVFDTQTVSGTPVLADGVLGVSDLALTDASGGRLDGSIQYDFARDAARAEVMGKSYALTLPRGERFRTQDIAAVLQWTPGRGLTASAEARNGQLVLPTSPYRVETGFEKVFAAVTLPPASAASAAPTLKLDARLHDFFFQRKWGWRDATAFFTGIGRGTRGPTSTKRARPWDLDLNLEATGPRNRIDTDVLRMTFAGDARITGTYPYMLVNGKVSGLQGEVGQTRQAYVLRDFEIKWDNVTVEDGALHVEGEKRLRSDCRADTRQTCQISVRLDGRLEDVGFVYETDCAQSTGEPVSPSVLINSMAQGCYVSETPGGEGNYGSAAFAMLEPALNDRLSRGVSRGSGGFIKSTQVSGLSALIGSDSSGLEAVALEVESRSLYRTALKGRAGYHPETKLANPMEYRLAAEYRPPFERVLEDSLWRARLRNRITVEAAVETRPEGRDIEEERRVRQRAGLRYRHRFWNLW